MKKKLICLLMIISCLGLAGCSQGQTTTEPRKTEKIIRIGVMPDVESIPLIIAEKNGYFEKEGVQVKLVHFKSAKDRDSALQGGEHDRFQAIHSRSPQVVVAFSIKHVLARHTLSDCGPAQKADPIAKYG